jgi:hypothetical protein
MLVMGSQAQIQRDLFGKGSGGIQAFVGTRRLSASQIADSHLGSLWNYVAALYL